MCGRCSFWSDESASNPNNGPEEQELGTAAIPSDMRRGPGQKQNKRKGPREFEIGGSAQTETPDKGVSKLQLVEEERAGRFNSREEKEKAGQTKHIIFTRQKSASCPQGKKSTQM